MTIIDRPTIFIDVDETLVAWHCTYFKPMQNNIDSLIRHAERGHYVVVWSAGGHEWAARVVKELGLADYVDLVMTKPRWYLDDMPADSWMARYWDKQGSADGEAKAIHVVSAFVGEDKITLAQRNVDCKTNEI